MINVLPLTIESLVAVLLLLTILYCVRLNEQLKRLKADGTSMQQTIAELIDRDRVRRARHRRASRPRCARPTRRWASA